MGLHPSNVRRCWDPRCGPGRSRRQRSAWRRSSGRGRGAGLRRRAPGTAREGGRAGAPRRPVAWEARAPRSAAWGRGGRACGLLGDFSPGLACGSRAGPRPRGPGCRVETHRKGPDPHLGVLPAARAFAQIRHGARPLPSGGFGSHPEAPVSHLRRAGRRGATLGAAARPPGWAEELAGPWAAAAGTEAAQAPAAGAWLGNCAGAVAPRGAPSRPARLPLSRSSAMAAAAATDKHLTAQAERPPPPSPPPPQRDEIRPRGWRGEEGGRRAGEWREWGEGGGRTGGGGGWPRRGTLRSRENRASAHSQVRRGEARERRGQREERRGTRSWGSGRGQLGGEVRKGWG